MSQMVTVVDNCILCNYFGLSLAEEGKNPGFETAHNI